jgi:hypothetical protein
MATNHNVRELALESLLRLSASGLDQSQIGRAVLLALDQAGNDFKQGPSLEEMKVLLADVARLARHGNASQHIELDVRQPRVCPQAMITKSPA